MVGRTEGQRDGRRKGRTMKGERDEEMEGLRERRMER